MTAGAPRISFAPLVHGDLPALAEWMRRAHWREWWGEPEAELDYVVDMIEGRDSTRPYVFHVDGEPLGYIQVWFIADQREDEALLAEHPWLALLPDDTIGVDLSIARADKLGKGIGSAVLAAFVADLRAQRHRFIIIDPDPENHRAVRAYEKAGFRIIPELLGRSGDSLIMKHEDQESREAA